MVTRHLSKYSYCDMYIFYLLVNILIDFDIDGAQKCTRLTQCSCPAYTAVRIPERIAFVRESKRGQKTNRTTMMAPVHPFFFYSFVLPRFAHALLRHQTTSRRRTPAIQSRAYTPRFAYNTNGILSVYQAVCAYSYHHARKCGAHEYLIRYTTVGQV